MGTFFEEELQKICGRVCCLKNQKYVANVCYGEIGDDLRAKIFFDSKDSEYYDSLVVKVINRTKGEVDSICMRFMAMFGHKKVDSPCYPKGVVMQIFVNPYETPRKPKWHVYKPAESDYGALTKALTDYLSVFADISYQFPDKRFERPAD